LVGSTLAGLGPGALVATGSVRRRAQLAAHRPDLTFAGLRGNIATRLAQVGRVDAVLVALAALHRLGYEPSDVLDPSVMLPQVGQGALAVECRADDEATRALLATIEHRPTRRAVDAERAFLSRLGGGCDLPVGGFATIAGNGMVELTGVLASNDGRVVMRHAARGTDPVMVGDEVGGVLARAGAALAAP
ncbi:MAG: hydroxymethylbilane synthase, partial [Acidimicrobiales bacterium]